MARVVNFFARRLVKKRAADFDRVHVLVFVIDILERDQLALIAVRVSIGDVFADHLQALRLRAHAGRRGGGNLFKRVHGSSP